MLVHKLEMWWHPPSVPGPNFLSVPVAASFFQRRLFLCMPRKLWSFDFKCPVCKTSPSLTSKGLYNRVRSVIDLNNRYYLASEYLEFRSCTGTFISYDSRLLGQLPDAIKMRFPIVFNASENHRQQSYSCV